MVTFELSKCKRITIVGVSGSGKSTLAQRLGDMLNLPVCHLDCLFWQPNWVKTDKEVFLNQVKEITEKDKWIIDGLYQATILYRFSRADIIIFLNYPKDFCIESIKASRQRNEKRVGTPDFCDEQDDEIDYESWGEFSEKYPEIMLLLEKFSSKVLEFQSRKELENYLLTMMPK